MSIAMPVAPEQVEAFRAEVRPADFRPSSPGHPAQPSSTTRDTSDTEFHCSLNGNGRLRMDGLSPADRHLAVVAHLSPFAAFLFWPFVLTPLVIWLVRKDKSTFVDDHGREIANVLISALLVVVLGIPAGIITVGLGWLAAAAWFVVLFISMIRGAVAAGHGEFFRYPMTFRFLS